MTKIEWLPRLVGDDQFQMTVKVDSKTAGVLVFTEHEYGLFLSIMGFAEGTQGIDGDEIVIGALEVE